MNGGLVPRAAEATTAAAEPAAEVSGVGVTLDPAEAIGADVAGSSSGSSSRSSSGSSSGSPAGSSCGSLSGSSSGLPSGSFSGPSGERVDAGLLASLGVGAAPVTLLQFSSAFCAPCRAVRRVSSEVAGMLPEVQHVEVDAESHLDAVRALGISRTPTLLVLDAEGRVVKRATGVPAKPQLIAVAGGILLDRQRAH